MTPAKKKSWSARLVPAAILLVAVGLVAAVMMMPASEQEATIVTPPPVDVSVEPVRAIPEIAETFELPGSVEPNRVVEVSAEVAGRIEAYGVRPEQVAWHGRTWPEGEKIDEGEPVVEGQVLVQINRDILQAETDRAQAKATYDAKEYERLLGLQARGATTAREILEAETNMNVSRAILEVARHQLHRTTLHSPISGVLDRMMHEVGEYVQAGMSIARIVELDPVKVVVDVPERDIAYLSIGQEVEIRVEPDEPPVAGTISYIGSLADPQTRSSRIEITIPNADNKLRSGQIVRVQLTRRVRHDVVMIPLKAVMPLEQGYEVFVADNGVARARNVQLGFIRQDRVLARGLESGDQLIVQGHRLVAAGQKINVVNSDPDQPQVAATQPAADAPAGGSAAVSTAALAGAPGAEASGSAASVTGME